MSETKENLPIHQHQQPYPIEHFDVRNLPVKNVIVYAERAEVKRCLKVFAAAGRTNLVISNISPVIERQSIRVEGQKTATIVEVCYDECTINAPDSENTRLNELEKEKLALMSAKTALEDQTHVLSKRLEVLDGVAGQIGQNVLVTQDIEAIRKQPIGGSASSAFLLCEDAMKNLTSFLDFYGKSASETKQELRDKESELVAIKNKLEVLERELDQLRCKSEYDTHKRHLHIVIEMEESGMAEIFFSYQVYCASWKPCYDIRASTSGFDPTSNNSLTIFYYGIVEQKTDEDWKDAEIILSTATPCFAGVVPTLPTLVAEFKRQPFHRSRSALRRKLISNESQEEDIGIGSFEYNEYTDALALQRLTVTATNTQCTNSDHDPAMPSELVPSTYFPVEIPATITGDGQHHKVSIAKLELEKPEFYHEVVPSKSASAFISIVVINSSTLPFLPGTASIFLNNSFISTLQLKAIMPGEEFRCLLGVDNSVKVEYKQGHSTTQIGFMSKSNLSTYDQTISVRNAKVGQNVRITVREPIPKPTDEKIKICVISPDLRNNRVDQARLTKEHNLEWVINLAAGEQKELSVKWSAEYPISESVIFSTAVNAAKGDGNNLVDLSNVEDEIEPNRPRKLKSYTDEFKLKVINYDARVQTDDKTKFQLFYYGNIQQTSCEDWNDVELLLSTASPRSGGALPKLPTLKAQLIKPIPVHESVTSNGVYCWVLKKKRNWW